MLMKLLECGVPLPLSNIRNPRSFIRIDNLVDLVLAAAVKLLEKLTLQKSCLGFYSLISQQQTSFRLGAARICLRWFKLLLSKNMMLFGRQTREYNDTGTTSYF